MTTPPTVSLAISTSCRLLIRTASVLCAESWNPASDSHVVREASHVDLGRHGKPQHSIVHGVPQQGAQDRSLVSKISTLSPR